MAGRTPVYIKSTDDKTTSSLDIKTGLKNKVIEQRYTITAT